MATPAKPRRCWADESEDLGSPELEPLPSLHTKPDFQLSSEPVPGKASKDTSVSQSNVSYPVDCWNLALSVTGNDIERFLRNFGIEPVENSSVRRGKTAEARTKEEVCITVQLASEEGFQKALKFSPITLNKSIDPTRSTAHIVKADETLVELPSELFEESRNKSSAGGGSYSKGGASSSKQNNYNDRGNNDRYRDDRDPRDQRRGDRNNFKGDRDRNDKGGRDDRRDHKGGGKESSKYDKYGSSSAGADAQTPLPRPDRAAQHLIPRITPETNRTAAHQLPPTPQTCIARKTTLRLEDQLFLQTLTHQMAQHPNDSAGALGALLKTCASGLSPIEGSEEDGAGRCTRSSGGAGDVHQRGTAPGCTGGGASKLHQGAQAGEHQQFNPRHNVDHTHGIMGRNDHASSAISKMNNSSGENHTHSSHLVHPSSYQDRVQNYNKLQNWGAGGGAHSQHSSGAGHNKPPAGPTAPPGNNISNSSYGSGGSYGGGSSGYNCHNHNSYNNTRGRTWSTYSGNEQYSKFSPNPIKNTTPQPCPEWLSQQQQGGQRNNKTSGAFPGRSRSNTNSCTTTDAAGYNHERGDHHITHKNSTTASKGGGSGKNIMPSSGNAHDDSSGTMLQSQNQISSFDYGASSAGADHQQMATTAGAGKNTTDGDHPRRSSHHTSTYPQSHGGASSYHGRETRVVGPPGGDQHIGLIGAATSNAMDSSWLHREDIVDENSKNLHEGRAAPAVAGESNYELHQSSSSCATTRGPPGRSSAVSRSSVNKNDTTSSSIHQPNAGGPGPRRSSHHNYGTSHENDSSGRDLMRGEQQGINHQSGYGNSSCARTSTRGGDNLHDFYPTSSSTTLGAAAAAKGGAGPAQCEDINTTHHAALATSRTTSTTSGAQQHQRQHLPLQVQQPHPDRASVVTGRSNSMWSNYPASAGRPSLYERMNPPADYAVGASIMDRKMSGVIFEYADLGCSMVNEHQRALAAATQQSQGGAAGTILSTSNNKYDVILGGTSTSNGSANATTASAQIVHPRRSSQHTECGAGTTTFVNAPPATPKGGREWFGTNYMPSGGGSSNHGNTNCNWSSQTNYNQQRRSSHCNAAGMGGGGGGLGYDEGPRRGEKYHSNKGQSDNYEGRGGGNNANNYGGGDVRGYGGGAGAAHNKDNAYGGGQGLAKDKDGGHYGAGTAGTKDNYGGAAAGNARGGGYSQPSNAGGPKGGGKSKAYWDHTNPQSPPEFNRGQQQNYGGGGGDSVSNIGSEVPTDIASTAPPGSRPRLNLKPRTKPIDKPPDDPLARWWDRKDGPPQSPATATTPGTTVPPNQPPGGESSSSKQTVDATKTTSASTTELPQKTFSYSQFNDKQKSSRNTTNNNAATTPGDNSYKELSGGDPHPKHLDDGAGASNAKDSNYKDGEAKDGGGRRSGTKEKNSKNRGAGREAKKSYSGQNWQGYEDWEWEEWEKQQQSTNTGGGGGKKRKDRERGRASNSAASEASAWSKKQGESPEHPGAASNKPHLNEQEYPSLSRPDQLSRADADTSWRK
ncbi:unnamed protein product [Amoebophrya sp. A120]|nr:unnamed protein product [Amoebophrya sp. A120]|eukprot:GSA120T00023663001.1